MTQTQLDGVVRHLRTLRATKQLTEASDAQLLQRFTADHEEGAFAMLLRRHGAMVLGVSRRVLGNPEDAEDVFQAAFLLLARKAGSIRKQASVASWLYGVAHRLAMRVRMQESRRHVYERQAANMRDQHKISGPGEPDVRAILDTALGELPERYRAALVLCYLEGLTHEEAARQLGCPLATLRTRVARGRKLLRDRLTRHGLTLSAAGVLALLVASAAPAAAPAALRQAAMQAAVPFTAGQSTATLCSSRVAELVESGLTTMFVGKTKLAAVLLLAASFLAGVGALVQFPPAALVGAPPAIEKSKPAAPAQPSAKDEDKQAVTFSGCVLGPGEKPVAGAKVYYHFITREDEAIPVRATTTAQGRFAFTLTQKDVPLSADAIRSDPLREGHIVVKAEGFTIGWLSLPKPDADLTLHVARDDAPIEGRILNLEGKPLAGLRVSALSAAAPKNGDSSDFVKALRSGEALYAARFKSFLNRLGNPIIGRNVAPLLPSTKTNAEGRFRLPGFAKEQLVELRIEGPAIETQNIFVLHRARPAGSETLLNPPSVKDREMFGPPDRVLLRWNGFDHAAPPGQVVTGTVRDEASQKPIAGAIVESYVLAGTKLAQNTIYHTVADAQGRYRFTGLPRRKGNRVRIRPPQDQPYFPVVKEVPPWQAFAETTLDVSLRRGIWVDVTVKDKRTGKPVPGYVSYFVLPEKSSDQPFFVQPFGDAYNNFMAIRNDGTFRFAALPRRAIIAFRADWDKYPIAREASFIRLPSGLSSSNFQAFATINPQAEDASVKVKFVLDTGGVVKGKLIGPDGQPLSGVLAGGLRDDWFRGPGSPLKTAEFTAIGLTPDCPRLLCFAHWKKKLAGSVVVRGDEQGPIRVQLAPWGTVSGRLLDAAGKPIPNATLWFTELPRRKRGQPMSLDTGWHVVEHIGGQPSPDPRTDVQGRFHVEGLVPGLKYNLALVDKNGAMDLDQVKWPGLAFSSLIVKPGEAKELGDIKLQPFPKE